MKSKKPINPRWQEEIAFMQSPGFRVVVTLIAIAIIGYNVSDWLMRRHEYKKSLNEGVQGSVYVPSPPPVGFKTDGGSTVAPTTAEVRKAPITELESTPHWDWIGDTDAIISGAEDTDDPEPLDDDHQYDVELDELAVELVDEESDELRTRANEAVLEAEDMLSHSIPLLVEHLNTRSTEEQWGFLSELKSTMTSYFPAQLKRAADKDPRIAERGWDFFIEQMHKHRFEPPD